MVLPDAIGELPAADIDGDRCYEVGPIATMPSAKSPEAMANDPTTLPIAHDEVRNIARLANLELSPDELEHMTRELGQILSYVRQLQELDVSQVEPTMGGLRAGACLAPTTASPGAHSVPQGSDDATTLPLRADEPGTSLPLDLALREAPQTTRDGFAVPAFMDEG